MVLADENPFAFTATFIDESCASMLADVVKSPENIVVPADYQDALIEDFAGDKLSAPGNLACMGDKSPALVENGVLSASRISGS